MFSPDGRKTFPLISECNLSTVNHRSIAADLDGTLLKAKLSFPYYILIAIEAGSLLRGLILFLSIPIISFVYNFISESLAAKILIFITFCGVRFHDIEDASRSVLPRFYAADVRSDTFDVFDRCERKVIVTANPTVMVETFSKEVLGVEKVIGTEIEVDVRTKRATGFVTEPGVMIGERKKVAVMEEFGEDLPDIGIGDRRSDHEFMSVCKGTKRPFCKPSISATSENPVNIPRWLLRVTTTITCYHRLYLLTIQIPSIPFSRILQFLANRGNC